MAATFDESRRIAERRPSSVRWAWPDGTIPLHDAAARRQDANLVQFLVEQWPESVQMADAQGRLALHHASSSGSHAELDTFQFLVLQYPGAVCVKDDKGRIPLHHALQRKKPLDVIEFLVGQ
jgi:ankyrin repeat protein